MSRLHKNELHVTSITTYRTSQAIIIGRFVNNFLGVWYRAFPFEPSKHQVARAWHRKFLTCQPIVAVIYQFRTSVFWSNRIFEGFLIRDHLSVIRFTIYVVAQKIFSLLYFSYLKFYTICCVQYYITFILYLQIFKLYIYVTPMRKWYHVYTIILFQL